MGISFSGMLFKVIFERANRHFMLFISSARCASSPCQRAAYTPPQPCDLSEPAAHLLLQACMAQSVTERLQSIQLRHIEQHPGKGRAILSRPIFSVVPSILHKRLVLLQSGSDQLCATLWTAAFSRRPSRAAAGALF